MLTRNENASDHIRLRLVVPMLAWNTCGHQEMWLDVLSISYATYWKPSSKTSFDHIWQQVGLAGTTSVAGDPGSDRKLKRQNTALWRSEEAH